MSISPKAVHATPAAVITHTVVTMSGAHTGDIHITHARTTDARISVVFSGMLVTLYSCDAAQGLLEAFIAARGHIATLPRLMPAAPPRADEPPAARTTLAMDWTRRPDYAAEQRASMNRLKTATVHWVDLYTGPITWRFRDQLAVLSTIEVFTQVHRSAAAVFLDGPQYKADPINDSFTAA